MRCIWQIKKEILLLLTCSAKELNWNHFSYLVVGSIGTCNHLYYLVVASIGNLGSFEREKIRRRPLEV